MILSDRKVLVLFGKMAWLPEEQATSPCARVARSPTAMSIVPPTPAAEPKESLEEQFQRLASAWLAATTYISSSTDLVAHPAFQAIVGLGPAVIPLLLRELAKGTGPWHRALRRVTGTDPVPPADRGDVDRAAEAWLRWGKERGYTW
jgi:hypothetical protein